MNIQISKVNDQQEASEEALEFLKARDDENTLLLLSGGISPASLYKLIADDGTLKPGAVAMVDERYGTKMHDNSNEKMIVNTGLVEFLASKGVPFYAVLEDGVRREQTAINYEKTLRELFAKYPKKVAVMGLGADGHTAGIKPRLEYDHTKWVVAYDDVEGFFGKRVTTTFECLEQIDEFILLVFGEAKKEVLKKMLEGINQNIMPIGFYKNSEIPTTVFTDIPINSNN